MGFIAGSARRCLSLRNTPKRGWIAYRHNVGAICALANLHAGNVRQKCYKGSWIFSLEDTGHLLALEFSTLNVNWIPVVAIEFLGNFAQWSMLEHELAPGPCQSRRDVHTVLRSAETRGRNDDAI